MGWRFQRWMAGRNGLDALAKTCLVLSVILFIITSFSRSSLLYFVTLAVLIYAYFRIMSRNVQKRYYENQKYLQMTASVRDFFRNFKNIGWKTRAFFTELGRRIRYGNNTDRAAYRIYKCPSCGQKVRVPKGKGRIQITCPKCRTSFIKRT